ncbi:hypothetical protein ACWJJH_03500 [Endozoicomonadaceae bacterium StTr2]
MTETPEALSLKAVSRLLDKWQLSPEQKTGILPLEQDDTYERVALLLSIHRSLRLLYPHNPELLYGWPMMRSQDHDGLSPLDIMLDEGLAGIRMIASSLENSLQR